VFGRTPAQFVLTAGPWRFVIAIDRMQAAASQLATQVTEAEEAGRRRSWRKVTTLLAAFGVGRLTPGVRDAVGAALYEARLTCEPAMERMWPVTGSGRATGPLDDSVEDSFAGTVNAAALGALADGMAVAVTAGTDGTAQVWQLADGALVGSYMQSDDTARQADFFRMLLMIG